MSARSESPQYANSSLTSNNTRLSSGFGGRAQAMMGTSTDTIFRRVTDYHPELAETTDASTQKMAQELGQIRVPEDWKRMPIRLIKIYIVDTCESVPLADRILYKGDEKLTDSTDQELFYELPITTLLADHNAKRVTFKDKKSKDKAEMLEPARIRDLTMSVVEMAKF